MIRIDKNNMHKVRYRLYNPTRSNPENNIFVFDGLGDYLRQCRDLPPLFFPNIHTKIWLEIAYNTSCELCKHTIISNAILSLTQKGALTPEETYLASVAPLNCMGCFATLDFRTEFRKSIDIERGSINLLNNNNKKKLEVVDWRCANCPFFFPEHQPKYNNYVKCMNGMSFAFHNATTMYSLLVEYKWHPYRYHKSIDEHPDNPANRYPTDMNVQRTYMKSGITWEGARALTSMYAKTIAFLPVRDNFPKGYFLDTSKTGNMVKGSIDLASLLYYPDFMIKHRYVPLVDCMPL